MGGQTTCRAAAIHVLEERGPLHFQDLAEAIVSACRRESIEPMLQRELKHAGVVSDSGGFTRNSLAGSRSGGPDEGHGQHPPATRGGPAPARHQETDRATTLLFAPSAAGQHVRIRLAGVPVDGILDGTVGRWWPLDPPRAVPAPGVPSTQASPFASASSLVTGG